jgi:hypothetical protein
MAVTAVAKSDLRPNPPTVKTIRERLEHWREVMLQVKAGIDTRTSIGTVRISLDRWLDEWVDQIGQGPLPDVWDREWAPSWPVVSRMSKEA